MGKYIQLIAHPHFSLNLTYLVHARISENMEYTMNIMVYDTPWCSLLLDIEVHVAENVNMFSDWGLALKIVCGCECDTCMHMHSDMNAYVCVHTHTHTRMHTHTAGSTLKHFCSPALVAFFWLGNWFWIMILRYTQPEWRVQIAVKVFDEDWDELPYSLRDMRTSG